VTGELPIANYSVNKTSGTEPQAVLFHDTSKGINTTHNLSYGDGTWFNTSSVWSDQSKLYSHFGDYPTYMIVGNLNGTNTTGTVWLNFTESMKTNMTMNLTKIEEDKDTIGFIEDSTNSTYRLWDFGDGITSSLSNPNHTYSVFGIYTVSLNSSSSTSFNTTTFVNQINVTEKMKTNILLNSNRRRIRLDLLDIQQMLHHHFIIGVLEMELILHYKIQITLIHHLVYLQ